ncbi:MAG TPA: hypothetical protein PLV27_04915 [Anaerolineaceae bacterium]|nr:hypothetical protein [Anaerolineaceae bacterium]HOV06582.1 hypothetical protein [Anaerolineaceae bacterium]
MENDEILKRLEFQDAERRKDKQTINDLLAQVATLQETINAQKREITHLSVENKKSATLYVRVEEYEEALAKLKAELVKPAADLDKKIALLEKEIESQRAEDMSVINRRLLELQNEIKPINELKNDIQTKLGDDFHLSQRIEELAKQFPELRQKDEELLRAIKLSDDHDRIEAKRVSDLAIELTTIRKKIDDEKIASDSQKEYLKKLEALINDLQNREQQRIQEQIAFIETQSRQTIDREGFIKDWQEKKDQLQALSASLQAQMLDLQGLNRTIKEAQAEFDELNQRLERRLNEISEMNRLQEERLRQEWISFKADDQKRWSNYSLNQEEMIREKDREMTKVIERLTKLEDTSLQIVDSVQIINEETEKRVRTLLVMANEIMSSFERSIGKKG